jgi:Uma2 family endonuclease
MTTTLTQTKTHTPDEYLALEVQAETRHEYRNGTIIPMTGGTPAHNEIVATLIFLLKTALRAQPYSIFVTDQRLWIPDANLYTYPDTMIIPRPVALQPGCKDTVLNPILIAEVLSDSTQAYDRGDKLAAYRTIASLQEYLLIDQSRPIVEQYVKQGENQWLLREYCGVEQRLSLESIDTVTLPLADLYEAILSAQKDSNYKS